MNVRVKITKHKNKAFSAKAVVENNGVELYEISDARESKTKEGAIKKLAEQLALKLETTNEAVRAYRMAMMTLVGR